MWPFSRRRKPAPITRVEPRVVSVRQFKAAEADRLKSVWSVAPMTINEIIRRDLRALRARSRAQGESDPYARKFISLVRSNVIGPEGVLYQSRVTDAAGKLQKPINQALELAWWDWCKPEHCDMRRQLGFAELCRQAIGTIAEDGECIIRLIGGTGPYGLALQFLDAERLDLNLDRDASIGRNAIRMGIEIDEWQRPVAYHFSSKEGDYHYGGRRYLRIPAEEIIHAYLPFRAGAWRGVPWNATALVRLHMLDGYEDAALVNARAGAENVGMFLTEDGVAPVGQVLDDGTTTGTPSIEVQSEAGQFLTLPGNVRDFKALATEYPNGEFPTFAKQILRGVGAGLGISYHKISGDLESVNFSSGRLGEQEDRETWKALQNWFIETVLSRIFSAWCDKAVYREKIQGASWSNVDDYIASASWQPRRWAHIQPREEMNARETALKLKLSSRSRFIREDGLDPDEVWAEIEAENAALRGRGIDPTLPDQAPAADPAQPEPIAA